MRGEDVDLATIIGLLGALLIIMAAIFLGGDPVMFLDAPSFLIVIGGTVFVVMSKFGMNQFAGAFRVAGKAFLFRPEESGELIARIVETCFYELDAPPARVCSEEVPIPYAKHLEEAALPQVPKIVAAVKELLNV